MIQLQLTADEINIVLYSLLRQAENIKREEGGLSQAMRDVMEKVRLAQIKAVNAV